MSTDRTYYFLKMPVDYILHNLELKKLRLVENGDTYFIIYFKLLADALDSQGHIYYEGDLDNYAEDFSILYGDKPLMIKETILNCERLGLIDLEPGHIFLNRTEELTTSENQSTRRKRNQRAREKLLKNAELDKNAGNVTHLSQYVTGERDTSVTQEDKVTLERDNVTLERDINVTSAENVTLERDNVPERHAILELEVRSKKLELEDRNKSLEVRGKCRDKKNDSGSQDENPTDRLTDYRKVYELFKKECPSLNNVVRISDKRKGILNEFAKVFTAEQIRRGFVKAEKSRFLKGEVSNNGKPFRFDFDWFFNPANFDHVLEGKYDDRQGKKVQIEESATDYAALEKDLLAN